MNEALAAWVPPSVLVGAVLLLVKLYLGQLMAKLTGLEGKVDAFSGKLEHLTAQQARTVSVDDFSVSINRVYDRVNAISERLARSEGKAERDEEPS